MKPTAQQTEIRNEVIDVMIKQLGGNKFFLMTGSKPQYKDISTDSPLIALKLTKNNSKANFLTIQYIRSSDLYTLEFIKMNTKERKIVSTYENIYSDQLTEIFESETGLRTSLF
tara:strand:+ start:26 stop:367 length:342 start_codon:yes stop_codon:yes gene_type:complete